MFDHTAYWVNKIINIYERKGVPEFEKTVKEEMMWQTGSGEGMLESDFIWRSGAVRCNSYIPQNVETVRTMM